MGGRGRRHSGDERVRIRALFDEAVANGARPKCAAAIIGIHLRTLLRWQTKSEDDRKGPKTCSHKLTSQEQAHVLETLTSPLYRDLPPAQVVAKLADRGHYLASESTMYRLLESANLHTHRQASRPATQRRPRAHCADAPNRVWSWDITYLPTLVRGRFYFLYLALDIFSRKIVGWKVQE
jgi:putative transposase